MYGQEDDSLPDAFNDSQDSGYAGGGTEYWDCDSIIADHQKLSCFFRDEVPNYGHLLGNNGDALPARNRVELPFWLASELAMREYIDVELPKCFNNRNKNDLLANPNTVELHTLNPYFYEFGMKVFGLLDERGLSKLLSSSFASRAQLIMDYTQSKVYGGATDAAQDKFKGSLDETELKMYDIGMKSASAMKKWIGSDRQSDMLTRSDTLSRAARRK